MERRLDRIERVLERKVGEKGYKRVRKWERVEGGEGKEGEVVYRMVNS